MGEIVANMSEVLGGLLFLTWTTNGYGQVGSSLGGRALIVAFAMMCVIAVPVLAQKLLPPQAAIDVPLALAITALIPPR